MTGDVSGEIKGERALREGEADRLGFGEVASRIANSIVDRASAEGVVIGVDGQWGSGKSSLLHLIERALGQLSGDRRPTIINFRPWLVGNRDALLTSLFSELAEKIARVNLARGDATQATVRKAKRTAKAVRKFARSLSRAGELVETAGAVWSPLTWLGKGLRGIGVMSEKGEDQADLAALKDKIVRELRELDHRFIITIDDVDRLEPAEVIEVLRLVRSVADFPNIVYMLCYDVERLAEAIQRGANVEDGSAFLEKIVQLTVMVPKPEPFELRQWFAEDLEKITGPIDDDVRERLKAVIDQEGAVQLRTPRSVVRTLDSVRFFWPAVRAEHIDISDLVWLQLIKDGAPKLYRWIETYVASVSATSFGTTAVTEPGKEARLQALLEAMGDQQSADLMYRHLFSDQLPGVQMAYSDDEGPFKIHQEVSVLERQAAIDGRRLSSPDHYRMYFSLIGPSHAITQAGFDSFWTAAESGSDDTAVVLLAFHSQVALGSLRKSDVLFERLRAMDAGLWTSTRAKNLLLAFGEMMDDAYRQNPEEQNFIVTSWDRAERLVPGLYAQLAADEREAVNETLFSQGRALGWLTSILRDEIFAHGKFGNRKKPAENWLMPDAEFNRACELMIARYRSMSLHDILATPRPIHILFAWNQAGDVEGPRALLAEATKDDEGLIDTLDAMKSAIESSDQGRYMILKRENIEPFMDFELVQQRLSAIAQSNQVDLSGRAKRLLEAASKARDW